MAAPIDPNDAPLRPTLSRGFWLMMALSSLSLVAAAVVAFRNPKPSSAETVRPKPGLASPPTPRTFTPSAAAMGASGAVDLAEVEAWLDAEDAPPPHRPRMPAAPGEAVEVDDDFGAALQPAGVGSVIDDAASLLRTLGEWAKGR